MIYTITLNPSLDLEMKIERIKTGTTNRSVSDSLRLGGKGINVSQVLKNLETESCIFTFVAGFVGAEIEKRIDEANLKAVIFHLPEGNSRINVKVKGTAETELNGAGPIISSDAMKELYEQLNCLKEEDVLILSGNIPNSLSDNLYETILSVVSEKKVKCVVDASKDLLVNCLKHHPFLIKPNRQECEEIFQRSMTSTHELIEAGRQLREMGALNVLISLGAHGGILIDENYQVHQRDALQGESLSSVGAGDSMVAGFVAAYEKTKNYEEAFKVSMACGCATAFSSGLADYDTIHECYDRLGNERIILG